MEKDEHTQNQENIEPKQPVEIELTDAQLSQLYLDASPDAPAVQEWLNSHGITAGESVIVKKQDGSEIVVATDESNFFVTNPEATLALPAERARSMIDIENAIDQRSVEIAEAEPRLTREEEEEIGEVALDAMGVEEPEITEESSIDHQELSHDEIQTELSRAIGFLETDGQELGMVDRTMFSVLREHRIKLLRAFESNDYPVGALQTLMRRAVDDMYMVRGAIGRYSEALVPETVKKVEMAETAALQTPSGSLDGVGVSHDKDTIIAAGDALEQFGRGELVKTIQELEDIIQQSYSRQIDTSEVEHALSYLKSAYDKENGLQEDITKAARSTQAIVDRFKELQQRANSN